jgi:hypothetical protein
MPLITVNSSLYYYEPWLYIAYVEFKISAKEWHEELTIIFSIEFNNNLFSCPKNYVNCT